MNVTPVFPGTYYVCAGGKALLAGCPPEVVKVLMQRKLASPDAILLPDIPVSHGESQIAIEFPLYHHIFFGAQSDEPDPLLLCGNPARVKAALELLELTLFGPPVPEMVEWGMPEEQAEALSRETRWFHLKDKSGKPYPLDKLVTSKSFDDEPIDVGWIQIKRIRTNVFELSADGERKVIDLNLEDEQGPPYPVNVDLTPTTLVKLGIEVLGGSTGFSTTQASSGLALCYNGNYMLIDAIPFLNYHLRARGIARNQINSIFLSHIHDDHCNLISLLQYNRRIRVLTTEIIYRMMLRKLALTLDRSEASLADYFIFQELVPGKETNFFGLRINAFWSSHSIPTIGAFFETTHSGVDYRIIFSGDTQALSDVKKMRRTGVVTQERFLEISKLYETPANLLLADGGAGQIHGDPADALESPAERIVFMHLDRLNDKFDAHFTTASSGKRYPVLRGETDYNLTRTIEFLLQYFPGMPPIWISNLLANQHVLTYNSGDIIIREGAKSEGYVYMILTGHAEVIHHDGKQKHFLTTMEAGELIGEMSAITGQGRRNASVIAVSPVIVTAFSENSFREYIQLEKLEGQLKAMWQNRELLQTFTYLKSLQQPVAREMSRCIALKNLPPRQDAMPLSKICNPFGLIMPLGKELTLKRGGKTVTVVPQKTPIMCSTTDTLVSEAEFQYLLLTAEAAANLRHEIPAFRFFWEETLGLPIPS